MSAKRCSDCRKRDRVPLRIRCKHCDHLLCTKCSIIIGNRKFCETCAKRKELNHLCTVITAALRYLNETIVRILSDYSVGYIFKCCNVACTNSVIINNIAQLQKKRDHRNRKIHYYVPTYLAQNKATVTIHHRKYRIFCSKCTRNKLIRCGTCCIKQEPLHSHCALHPICSLCGVYLNEIVINDSRKCKSCRNFFCDDHMDEMCEKCMTRSEFKVKRRTIQIALNKRDIYHEIIIKWITEYSMGFVTRCRNNSIMCQDDIAWDNRFQFNKHIDYKKDRLTFWGELLMDHSDEYYGYQGYINCAKCRNIFVATIWAQCAHGKCNKVDTRKCVQCLRFYCDSHLSSSVMTAPFGLICEDCFVIIERNKMTKAVRSGLQLYTALGMDRPIIIDSIVEYAVGYIVQCTFKSKGLRCCNDIVWDNKYQMRKAIDYLGNGIAFQSHMRWRDLRNLGFYDYDGNIGGDPICSQCNQLEPKKNGTQQIRKK